MALLDGQVLNVKNVFRTIGLTNASREISRMVEKPFGVEISRTPKKGKSKYGQDVTWVDYYLIKSEHNLPGIAKMEEYVQEQSVSQKLTEPQKDVQINKLF